MKCQKNGNLFYYFNMEEWNPGYWRIKKGTLFEEFIPYEKRWYCSENKIIHQNEKQKDSCKYCNKSLET